eukprot:766888-Hanusia_phi.AAC.1
MFGIAGELGVSSINLVHPQESLQDLPTASKTRSQCQSKGFSFKQYTRHEYIEVDIKNSMHHSEDGELFA